MVTWSSAGGTVQAYELLHTKVWNTVRQHPPFRWRILRPMPKHSADLSPTRVRTAYRNSFSSCRPASSPNSKV
jgi:hypothetical protein